MKNSLNQLITEHELKGNELIRVAKEYVNYLENYVHLNEEKFHLATTEAFNYAYNNTLNNYKKRQNENN